MQELGSSYPQGDAKVAAGGEADLLVCVCVGGGGGEVAGSSLPGIAAARDDPQTQERERPQRSRGADLITNPNPGRRGADLQP